MHMGDSLSKERAQTIEELKEHHHIAHGVSNGFKELGSDKLKTFITIKFNSMADAKERLNMSVADMREHYFELQRRLYCA